MPIFDPGQKQLDDPLELLLLLECVQNLEGLVRPQRMLSKQVLNDDLISSMIFFLVVL